MSISMKKPTAVTQDGWVTAALTEDSVVVELLLRLKHAGTVESAANIPLLRWGSRKPRSRLGVGAGVGGLLKKETDSARASPMTPLCWSGGSGSGGSSCPSADGFEDASRQSTCSTSTRYGSKVCQRSSISPNLLLLLLNRHFLLLLVSIWSIIGGSPRQIANSILLAVFRFRFPVYFADVIVRKRYIVEPFLARLGFVSFSRKSFDYSARKLKLRWFLPFYPSA